MSHSSSHILASNALRPPQCIINRFSLCENRLIACWEDIPNPQNTPVGVATHPADAYVVSNVAFVFCMWVVVLIFNPFSAGFMK